MNTPKTKRPVRYTLGLENNMSSGTSVTAQPGIRNPTFMESFIEFINRWPFLEDHMVWVFAGLLGTSHIDSARIAFLSVINSQTRIEMMRALLEKSGINIRKPEQWEFVIHEFKSLNKKRNEYVHNKWFTSSNGELLLAAQNSDYPLIEARTVPLAEINEMIRRAANLVSCIEALDGLRDAIETEIHISVNTDGNIEVKTS